MWPFSRLRRSAVTSDVERAPSRRLFGREYAVGVPYVLPKDMGEVNRLDFQHYMLRYALRGNYAAPLQSPLSILDVGTGTGRWAREVAALFPQANVIGTDIVEPKSDASAEAEMLAANYSFVQGNVLEGLPFDDGVFDFTHARLLLFAIPADRWAQVARELLRVTRPGGWVESVETGPQRNGGAAMDTIVGWITTASKRRGVDPLLGPRIADYLAGAGLTGMVKRAITLPVGPYGGRLGQMAAADVFSVVGGVKPLVVAQGIASEAEYDGALAAARADMERGRCELPFYITYGRRPA